MANKENSTSLDDILGIQEHSWLLLGTSNAINASQNFQRSGRRIVQNFKNAVEEAIPDYPDVPVEEMTPEQLQASIDKGNVLAVADNLLDQINKS